MCTCIMKRHALFIHYPSSFSMAQKSLEGHGLIIEVPRSHSHTPQSVGLFSTCDQTKAETSTWQHTTLARDRRPYLWRDSNPQSQQTNVRKPTLWAARPLLCIVRILTYKVWDQGSPESALLMFTNGACRGLVQSFGGRFGRLHGIYLHVTIKTHTQTLIYGIRVHNASCHAVEDIRLLRLRCTITVVKEHHEPCKMCTGWKVKCCLLWTTTIIHRVARSLLWVPAFCNNAVKLHDALRGNPWDTTPPFAVEGS